MDIYHVIIYASDYEATKQFDEAEEWTKGKVALNHEQGKDEVYFANIYAKPFYLEILSEALLNVFAVF